MTPSYQELPQPTKTCKRGHVYESSLKGCPVCMRQAVKEWRKSNGEKYKSIRSRYYRKNKEKIRKRHEETREKHSLRRIWRAMLNRCNDPKHSHFQFYGGRGIKVCDRWLGENGFDNFKRDMGERPTPKHEIDRRDNSLGYFPENCHWATEHEQSRNKRSNRNLTYNGKTQCLQDWAKELGISRNTLTKRLRLGWDEFRILSTPVDERHSHT